MKLPLPLLAIGLSILALGAMTRAPAGPEGDIALAALDTPGSTLHLRDLAGTPRVVMFWRSDCAPCRVELSAMARLEAAAGAGAVVTVALEPALSARAALRRYRALTAHAYVATGDPMAALEAASEGGHRLPYALALDRTGAVCARHVGLLGTDRIAQWMAECSR